MTYHDLEDNIVTHNKGIIKIKDLEVGDSLFGINSEKVFICLKKIS